MFDIQPMKAITVWQPYASLLAIRSKIHETRSWATKYRGPIAIHAGRMCYGPYACELPFGFTGAAANVLWPGVKDPREIAENWDELPRGCIIAVADLVNCWKIQTSKNNGPHCERYRKLIISNEIAINTQLYENDYLFGDWTPGRYAWEFANMRMLPEPIPAKGRQGLWRWKVSA